MVDDRNIGTAESGLIVKRGHVYEFVPKSGSYPGKAYALTFSSDSHGADRLVNVIVLSATPSPSCEYIRSDEFPGGGLYCNCGKLTFTERERLVRDVMMVGQRKMDKIDKTLMGYLGFNSELAIAESKIYKDLYFRLLKSVSDGKIDMEAMESDDEA